MARRNRERGDSREFERRGVSPRPEDDTGNWFFPPDMLSLVRAGLAKQRSWSVPWRRRPLLLYPVTETGYSALPLGGQETA